MIWQKWQEKLLKKLKSLPGTGAGLGRGSLQTPNWKYGGRSQKPEQQSTLMTHSLNQSSLHAKMVWMKDNRIME